MNRNDKYGIVLAGLGLALMSGAFLQNVGGSFTSPGGQTAPVRTASVTAAPVTASVQPPAVTPAGNKAPDQMSGIKARIDKAGLGPREARYWKTEGGTP